MFQRKVRYIIPSITNTIYKTLHTKIEEQDQQAKEKAKYYTNAKRHASERNLHKGDTVIVKQQKRNKLSPDYQPHPYTIIERKSSMIAARSEATGKSMTRNISHYKNVPKEIKFAEIAEEGEEMESRNHTTQSLPQDRTESNRIEPSQSETVRHN